MAYSILFKSSAAKVFEELDGVTQKRVRLRIDALAENPFPPGVRKISGEEHAYRIRIGDYRVVYDVVHKRLIVLILRIGHRREVYR